LFKRPHHRRIEALLRSLNSDVLQEAQCFFGGGTAIVLLLDEYRESVDVDFLCSSQDGYRLLRNMVTRHDLGGLLREPVLHVREVRADFYGIRTFVEIDGQPIKIEIINEGRIPLRGECRTPLTVPVLSCTDMYAEKLLANADRCYDDAVLSRDIIDVAMMIDHWGAIPPQAWRKARRAYGESVDRAYQTATRMIHDRAHLERCLEKMHMDKNLLDRIPALLNSTDGL